MVDFSEDRSLLLFVLLNTAVFAGAWFFVSRRVTACRSQAMLDTALLGYGVQYVSVGLPGIFGCLQTTSIVVTALGCVTFLLFASSRLRVIALKFAALPGGRVTPHRFIIVASALFVLTFTLAFAHSQANLPVISNDAMTYHFPAAVQWLQQQRITLFQTWFFNPANTFSPLAGSMFVVWMIAPFHSDVLARFVEIPALICVGIAMYRLCRQLGAGQILAALIAGAAVLARPIFLPSMMGKDDLFVAFFFLAALVALAPDRSGEKLAPARLGIALGLLLATKFTALLSVPLLLLAIDGPRWRWRGWITAICIATAFAGPWYLRNWILTGNPMFPMFGLFTTAASQAFHPWRNAAGTILNGAYGLPAPLAIWLAISWIRLSVGPFWRDPLRRTCALGIPLGLLLFFFQSPFPEVRFVLPVFLLLFACFALGPWRTSATLELLFGLPLLLLSLITVFGRSEVSVSMHFSAIALVVALPGTTAITIAKNRPRRWIVIAMPVLVASVIYTYINWTAYARNYRETLFDDSGGYAAEYPDLNRLWRFVNDNIPADATVAYTNMYLVYPLQGPSLQRRLVYAPTRPGLKTIADLGWLGSHLSGEQLVPAAIGATVASPDRSTWLFNLKKTGATYLIIGHGGQIGTPPESTFAADDPVHFHPVFAGPAGEIYQIQSW